MKNSAWYHKLWRKKADEFPVREDMHAPWQEMQQLLDKHMPAAKTTADKKPGKSVGSTIVSMLGFILPAAAMISTITFVAVKHPFKHKQENKQEQQQILKKQDNHTIADSTILSIDSSLSAATPTTDIQHANTNNAPGQLAHVNVIIASSTAVHHQNSVSSSAANPANIASYQSGHQSSARAASTYYLLEYPPQPAGLFPIIKPDTAQNNGGLWQAIGSDKLILSSAIADQKPKEGNNISAESDRDGISVDHADKQQANKLRAGRNQKMPKIKGSSSHYRVPFTLGDSTRLSIGLFAGLNWPGNTGNLFAGLSLGYQLQDKWHLYTGITLGSNQYITSKYQHASFAPRDTGVTFTIKDQRKAQVVTIPLTLEYAVSKLISINAGTQISIASQPKRVVKSSVGRSAYIMNVPNRIDTINHGHSIDTALNLTTINKFNIGISGGISVHLNQHLHIDARYQQNITPYLFNNSYLGNSKVYYHSVQIGLRYQFGH